MHFQLAAARISFVALVLAAAMALAAVAGVRLGLYSYAFGFKLMVPAVALGVVAFGAGAVFCYSAFQRNQGEGRRLGLAGFFGALLLLYPPVSTQLRGLTAPPIHDATTDPADPPRFVALAKARKPGMNSLEPNAEQPIHYHGEDTTVASRCMIIIRTSSSPMPGCSPRPRRPSGAPTRSSATWAGPSSMPTRRPDASRRPTPACGSAGFRTS